MKALVLFLLAVVAVPAMAQTMGARRIKAEMIQRTIDLENHAKEAKRQFRAEKVKEGCSEVAYLARNTQAHTRAVLGRMNSNKSSVRRMQNEAVEVLQIVDSLMVDCRSQDHADVDPESAARQMHRYADHMHDHRARIEDRSVEFNNSYEYEYEY